MHHIIKRKRADSAIKENKLGGFSFLSGNNTFL